jgi:hypothetical protein
MTRNELAKILEQFAVCVLHTSMTDMEPDEQYNLIAAGIDMIADTVMICTERKIPSPSAN